MTFKYFLPAIMINTLAINFQLEKLITIQEERLQQDINNKVNKDTNKSPNKAPMVEGCRGNSHEIFGEGCLCGKIK